MRKFNESLILFLGIVATVVSADHALAQYHYPYPPYPQQPAWYLVSVTPNGEINWSVTDPMATPETNSASSKWQQACGITPDPNVQMTSTVHFYTYSWPERLAPGGISTISESGSVTFVYRWLNPDGTPASNPPKHVTFLIHEDATCAAAPAYGDPNLYVVFSGGGSDGDGDVANLPNLQDDVTVDGKHLYQFDGSSGTVQFDVSLNIYGQASLAAQASGPGQISAACAIDVSLDDRRVVLTRQPYGGIDKAFDDNDDVTYGDTIFSYNDVSGGPSYPYPNYDTTSVVNWQMFQAEFIGSWQWQASGLSEPLSFAWTPDESEDTWKVGKWSMPFGSEYFDGVIDPAAPFGVHWQNVNDTPKQLTLYYIATDVDGAQATAAYVLTVHSPAEPNNDLKTVYKVHYHQVPGTTTLNYTDDTNTHDPPEPYSTTIQQGTSNTVSVQIGANCSPDPFSVWALLNVLNFSGQYQDTWSQSVSSTIGPVDIYPGQFALTVFVDQFKEVSGTLTRWSPDGSSSIEGYDWTIPVTWGGYRIYVWNKLQFPTPPWGNSYSYDWWVTLTN